MRLRALFICVLLSSLCLVNSVSAATNDASFASYWTSWDGPKIDLSQLSPKVSRLNLSFANIDPTTLMPIGSDGILDSSSGRGWKQSAYNAWTQFKLKHAQVKMLLSFGGASYADLWTTTLTTANAAVIAKNIAATINDDYPVYQFDAQYVPHIIGNVSLDGVDLDVEGSERLTAQQTNNVIVLIQALRQELPNKLIILTGFSTAADPASCMTTGGAGCSYVSSPHAGELLPVLTQISSLIDGVNDMAYDAGKNYNYQLSLNNYAQYVAKNKVSLGLDLENQWDPNGEYLESLAELNDRTAWAKANGYGAFVWALGASSGYPVTQQLDIVNQFASK
ncbi:MAG: hypothetical protein KAS93_02535 [Gammaproteobacteria bacterium]|nr:hypothetical protein [Gammaproteobacteria bacterium]